MHPGIYNNLLHYKSPAAAFTSAMVLGNGRIGASVYGGVEREKISLNEDTIWSGYPHNDSAPDSSESYRILKEKVLAGRFKEAEDIFESRLARANSDTYLPLGDMLIEFTHRAEAENYRRSLRLDTATANITYTAGGIHYSREYFVSYPDDALVIKLSASSPKALNFRVRLTSRLRSSAFTWNGDSLYVDGECPSAPYIYNENGKCIPKLVYSDNDEKRGVGFRMGVKAIANGEVYAKLADDFVEVRSASEAILYFKVKTSFNGYNRSPFLNGKKYYREEIEEGLEKISRREYREIYDRHTADFLALYGRVTLDLGQSEKSSLPTDERLKHFFIDKNDQSLYTLLFNLGRYLAISASRQGTQPANLQGIWNDRLFPPWQSNYTTNINTEMNYWPMESANLSELHEPLIDLITEISQAGRATAKNLYGGSGFCAHHNIDLWRKTTPPSQGDKGISRWSFWPFSSGWLCRHLWEHYEYNPNFTFLEKTVYPISVECCKFYLSMLTETKDGMCFVGGTSPENEVTTPDGNCSITVYSTMSNAIMRDLFSNTAKCCDLMGDSQFSNKLREMAKRIPDYKIGAQGQLLEYDEDYPEIEQHHRHISHLYGLHPAQEINPEDTPELIDAVKRSLSLRGDASTGWSLGWKINQWARLRDGDRALELLDLQLRLVEEDGREAYDSGGTYPNLLDAHPPFQIDGNFAATAGITEMLLQSREDQIWLLPALPSRLSNGSVTGLCAKGGLVFDLSWERGRLISAVVTAKYDCSADIHYNGICERRTFTQGTTMNLT